MHHVFISYSRNDIEVMRRVRDSLRLGGLDVWTDEELEPGTASWQDAIERALEDAKAIVVLLSPEAKQSVWIKRELNYASTLGRRLFPVLVRGNERESVPILLVGAQYIDLAAAGEQGLLSLQRAVHKFVEVPLPSPPAAHAAPATTPESDFEGQQLVMVPPPPALMALRTWGPLALLTVLILGFVVFVPKMLNQHMFIQIAWNTATLGILAVGMNLVVLSGGIDLALSSVIALSSLLAATMAPASPVGMFLICVGTALLIGTVCGWAVGILRRSSVFAVGSQPATAGLVPSLLVTLFAAYFLDPLTQLISGGQVSRVSSPADGWFANGGVSVGVAYLVILALGEIIYRRTSLRTSYHTMRTDRRLARNLPLGRILLTTHLIAGICTGVGAFMWLMRLQAAYQPGITLVWQILAAVLISGTSLFRSEGAIWRSSLGVLLLAVGNTGMNIMNMAGPLIQMFPVLCAGLFIALDLLSMPRHRLVTK